MIHRIVKDPLFLQQRSELCTLEDVGLAQDLRETLVAYQKTCLGLAANMIGASKRAIVISVMGLPVVMFNPEVITKKGRYETHEACLSLSGERPTERYKLLTVRYMDESWQPRTLSLEGLGAQVCQHELDHLEGILI